MAEAKRSRMCVCAMAGERWAEDDEAEPESEVAEFERGEAKTDSSVGVRFVRKAGNER